MVDTFPPEVQTFTVVGRLNRGQIDSPDAGSDPDMLPIAGVEVHFTPELTPPVFKVPAATTPTTIYQETVTGVTDESGDLKTPDGQPIILAFGGSPGIVPTGWTWRVQIEAVGDFPAREFSIYGSAGGVVNLATYIPVPENPGSEVPLWVQAVEDIEGYLNEVELIRGTLVVGASVVGDNLVMQRQDTTTFVAGNVRGPKGDQGDYTASANIPSYSSPYNIAPASQTTIRLTLDKNLTLTLNGTATADTAYTKTVILKQAASGGPYTVTWPASIEWASDAPAPSMPTVAGAELIVHLFWTGVAWRGIVAGVYFP